ncbi:MAG: COG4705 family protein [Chloroflexota bacterium]
MDAPLSRQPSRLRSVHLLPGLRKVPEVAALFWLVKLLTTAMGESTSDYFVFQINPYVAVILGCVGLAVALALQLWVRRYIAWVYWFTVVMVAVFGTMAADVAHVVMGIPYAVSTTIFACVLAIVFVAWYVSEHTLSIHTVYPGRREMYYWATVLAAFALGTAAGDLTASTFGLGYFSSIILFAALFVIPGLAYRLFGLNPIVAFWFAYVITRPLGASIADWLGKPFLGGLGLGDGKVALVLTLLIAIFVAYLAMSRVDVAPDQVAGAGEHSSEPLEG